MNSLFKIIAACLFTSVIVFTFVSCDLDSGYSNCSDERPYWCSTAKSCCKYRYNDGHGTCWSSMDGCRSSGYPCETCHIQED